MADEDKPPLLFPWINSSRVRKFEAWLWNHPKTAFFLTCVSVGLISSPTWFSDFWALFSNEAPVPVIMNWISGLPTISFSWYWLPVGLGTVMLVFITSLLWRQRKRLETEIAEARTKRPPLTPPASSQCPYELAHRVADHEARVIRDFVTVSRVAVWEHKLNDPVPTIKWGFMIKNDSIFAINLTEIRNNLFFEDAELAERRFEDHNEVQQLPPWREGSVVFEQRLSGPEAQYIRNTPDGTFRFNRLTVKVGNPNNFPPIEPQEIEIGNELEAPLNGRAYKDTPGTESLKKKLNSLKSELQKASGGEAKLTFEIDGKQSQVHATGGGRAGRRIAAKVRLRCMKLSDYPMAIREFHAALIKENSSEQVLVPQESALVVLGHPDMKIVDFSNGWTISEPLTDYRWFMFYLDITEQQLHTLSHDHFMRVTMVTVGQKPYSVDFMIDNWEHARSGNSNITLRSETMPG